jgi:hypothetical protein
MKGVRQMASKSDQMKAEIRTLLDRHMAEVDKIRAKYAEDPPSLDGPAEAEIRTLEKSMADEAKKIRNKYGFA